MPIEFPLGVEVHSTNGRCGRSTYIVLNPATEVVTHLVVRERQPSRIERTVPTRYVASSAAEVILLNCTKEEFATLERFRQTDFIYRDLPHHATDPELTAIWPYVVPAKRIVDDKVRSIAPGELAVRRGATVRATDGRLGRVDEFLVDPESGHITHLSLRESHLRKERRVCIPVSEIEQIEEKVVHLKIDREAAKALPSISIKRW